MFLSSSMRKAEFLSSLLCSLEFLSQRSILHRFCCYFCFLFFSSSIIKWLVFNSSIVLCLHASSVSVLVSLLSNCYPTCCFIPALHLFHPCNLERSLFAGFHVHVPDLDPGGLGRCHGPDPGGCGSYVGSSGGYLLHPLPSVRYTGEEPAVLFQRHKFNGYL